MHMISMPGATKSAEQEAHGSLSGRSQGDRHGDHFRTVFEKFNVSRHTGHQSCGRLETVVSEEDVVLSETTDKQSDLDQFDHGVDSIGEREGTDALELMHRNQAKPDTRSDALSNRDHDDSFISEREPKLIHRAATSARRLGPEFEDTNLQTREKDCAKTSDNVQNQQIAEPAFDSSIANTARSRTEVSLPNASKASFHGADLAYHAKYPGGSSIEKGHAGLSSARLEYLGIPSVQHGSHRAEHSAKSGVALSTPGMAPTLQSEVSANGLGQMPGPANEQISKLSTTAESKFSGDLDATAEKTRDLPMPIEAAKRSAYAGAQTQPQHAVKTIWTDPRSGASSTELSDIPPRIQSANLEVSAQNIQPKSVSQQTTLVRPESSAKTHAHLYAEIASDPDRNLTFSGEPLEEIAWDIRPQAGSPTVVHGVTAGKTTMQTHFAHQIADAIHRSPEKSIEIALSPAELGRVRMVLLPSEGSIVVNILAERADTLDLMRRHIDDLGRSFSELGYDDISFAFGRGSDKSDGQDTTQDHTTAKALSLDFSDAPAASEINPPDLTIAVDGVDLRV